MEAKLRHRRRSSRGSMQAVGRQRRADGPRLATRSASASCPTMRLPGRFRDLQGALNQRLAARAPRGGDDGCRHSDRGEKPMTKTEEQEAERHRAKMAKRKAVQDEEVAGKTDREGPADRPYRHRQGQIDGGLRPGAAHARPRQADRRRAVHQGRLAHRRARRARSASAIRSRGTRMGEGFTWETQDRRATSPRPSAPGTRRKS